MSSMIPWIDNEQHAATVFGPRQWVFPNALLIKMGSIILLTVYKSSFVLSPAVSSVHGCLLSVPAQINVVFSVLH